MAHFQIKAENYPTRCEICHQADQFDPATNVCQRCQLAQTVPQTAIVPTQQHFALSKKAKIWLGIAGIFLADTMCTICYPLRMGILVNVLSLFTGRHPSSSLEFYQGRMCGMAGLASVAGVAIFYLIPAFFICCFLVVVVLEVNGGKTPAWVQPPSHLSHLKSSQYPQIDSGQVLKPIFKQLSFGFILNILLFVVLIVPQYSLAQTVRYDYGSLTRLFLKLGVNVDQPDDHRWTALMYAIADGNAAMVDELISRGANVNATNHLGQTPLMCAAWAGKPDLVKRLLVHGARVNVQDHQGKSALMIALNTRSVDQILDRLDGSDSFDHLYALYPNEFEQRETLEPLLDCPESRLDLIDFQGSTLTSYAVRTGSLELVQRVLSKLPSQLDQPDKAGTTPLMLACKNKLPKLVEYLLSQGASPLRTDQSGQTALFYAAHVQFYNPHASVQFIDKLIEQGAEINVRDNHGKTPLMEALDQGNQEMVHTLLAHNPDIDIRDASGLRALEHFTLRTARFPGKAYRELYEKLSPVENN
ncbi:MAG: ankyrin repeat domain-containing protein [Acidobacteria bacterium]|nr:ankyrin repeat domain-containing protein [Acidobacteriota bacterium]